MNRREFLKLIPLAAAAQSLSGCIAYRYLTLDLNHVLLRSDVIDSFEKEREIVSKAKLTTTADGRIRVLFTRGNAYERGYQQGYLLRKEVHDNMGYLWDRALSKFKSEELFAEAFERMRPFMSSWRAIAPKASLASESLTSPESTWVLTFSRLS